jgi:arylsulfatase A-like enzyme
MLLDPAKDPHELTNLANDPKHADVVAKLSPLVRTFAKDHLPPQTDAE